MVNGTPSDDHSLKISIENLRLRDDDGNHNSDQMNDINVSQNLKQERKTNNGDVLPRNQKIQWDWWSHVYSLGQCHCERRAGTTQQYLASRGC